MDVNHPGLGEYPSFWLALPTHPCRQFSAKQKTYSTIIISDIAFRSNCGTQVRLK
jgi:hypothetical protein